MGDENGDRDGRRTFSIVSAKRVSMTRMISARDLSRATGSVMSRDGVSIRLRSTRWWGSAVSSMAAPSVVVESWS